MGSRTWLNNDFQIGYFVCIFGWMFCVGWLLAVIGSKVLGVIVQYILYSISTTKNPQPWKLNHEKKTQTNFGVKNLLQLFEFPCQCQWHTVSPYFLKTSYINGRLRRKLLPWGPCLLVLYFSNRKKGRLLHPWEKGRRLQRWRKKENEGNS